MPVLPATDGAAGRCVERGHCYGEHMKRRLLYEQLFLVGAIVIALIAWVAGGSLFPEARLTVVSILILVIFAAWFVDAILKSVKRRRGRSQDH